MSHLLGPIALLVTLLFVLVNIFNSVKANPPKSEGLTAVKNWVVMCILHVLGLKRIHKIILVLTSINPKLLKILLLKIYTIFSNFKLVRVL